MQKVPWERFSHRLVLKQVKNFMVMIVSGTMSLRNYSETEKCFPMDIFILVLFKIYVGVQVNPAVVLHNYVVVHRAIPLIRTLITRQYIYQIKGAFHSTNNSENFENG